MAMTASSGVHRVLIAGEWRAANGGESFLAENPATGEKLAEAFPISQWADVDAALSAGAAAARELRQVAPEALSGFLRRYAERIEARAETLVEMAQAETALGKSPRLKDLELPRTTTQLRQAADAALEGSWRLATIDSKPNIRSQHAAIGPVLVIGPNNFPFAFNGISGGDFAAAIAAGNPVIAKAHPSHPATTRMLAEEALAAVGETRLPAATVQLLYHMSNDTGLRMAADVRLGALAFTGSREGGLRLKAAADAVGKPAYLEMSSVNPLVILPGALRERGEKIAEEFAGSALAGTGQFCTNPGFVVLLAGEESERFMTAVKQRFEAAVPTCLLSAGVARALKANVAALIDAGATIVSGGSAQPGAGYRFANTILRASGESFLGNAEALQGEAFGNASLLIVAKDAAEAAEILQELQGNLTGSVYSDTQGSDDSAYGLLAPILRTRVGRLLNDKMPTGVALSPAMNHGGPFPATGHPGFTAVGIPASMRRFSMLECYDGVRPGRLPATLGNKNPNGRMWRLIDGRWTTGDVEG